MIVTSDTNNANSGAMSHEKALYESADQLLNSNKALQTQVFESSKGRRSQKTIGIADLCEGISSARTQQQTALMLENTRNWLYGMNEATRAINIGDYERYAFQMVRAVFPNVIAHEIVSVQPLLGPTGLVFYMRYLYSKTKGKALAGQDIHENPNIHYSSEFVSGESVGAQGSTNYTGNLDYLPVRATTVTFTDGAQLVTDDGQGNLVGDVNGGGNNTINYATGAFDFTFAATAANDVEANYEYDSENNEDLQGIDLNIEASPVLARVRKLRTRTSLEASQDLRAVHGLEAELELLAAATNEIKFEIDQNIISQLQSVAAAPSPTQFSRTAPSGISYTEHKLSFIDTLVEASNNIFKATQRAEGNWIVAGMNVMNIIQTLPGFRGDGKIQGRGVYRAGTLNDRWTIYRNSYIGDNEYLVGHKGESMYDTGYVWAPYQPVYTTPSVVLDDFQVRKGIASRNAQKVVDPRFYCKGSIA